jgi:hypothetical protein
MLNLMTMTWTQVSIDISHPCQGMRPYGLNLIGHSLALSPFDKKEIYIFGGRATDEANQVKGKGSLFVPAMLLTLNVETMRVTEVPIRNPPGDISTPESRIDQVFVRVSDEMVALRPALVEEKAPLRKGKNNRRAPVIPVKRIKLLPHPIIRLYGGSKLYSSGFCSGVLYDLYFVPVEKKNLTEMMEEQSAQEATHRTQSQPISLEAPTGRRMSSLEMSLASQCEGNEVFHMLNLKDDSTTKLLSPKRGLGGQYFTVKTSLSCSRSTFSRPGTALAASGSSSTLSWNPSSPSLPDVSRAQLSSRRPVSAPSPLLSDLEAGGTIGSEYEKQNGTTPSRKPALSDRARIKQYSSSLSPLTKGLTVHDARFVFNKLYPPQDQGRPSSP